MKRNDSAVGAIENDDIELGRAAVLIDVQHSAQLFHTGENSHLLGFHPAHAGGFQDGGEIGGILFPVTLHLAIDVYFLYEEVFGEGAGVLQ